MVEWVAKYLLEALFSGLLGVVVWAAKNLWRRQRAIENGIEALLRGQLVSSYYHYIERGWITLHGLEAVEKMYAEYHSLGGNGTVTKLVEDLRELPVLDKDRQTADCGRECPKK